jgi:hypothetical protein
MLAACGSPTARPEPPARSATPVVARPAPPTPPPPELPPPPPPDPEAEARAAEERARAEFERRYPWHGVAYHFLAQVRARPDGGSPVIGYLRRGAQFRASPTVRGPGCARGWAPIDGGGYVCRNQGFTLGERPQHFDPSPTPASLDAALPYVYAWVVRDDVPQYWRVPTPAEEAEVAAWMARQRAREDAAAELEPPPAAAPEPASDTAPEAVEAASGPAAPSNDGDPTEEGSTENGDDDAEVAPTPAEPDLEAPPGLGDEPVTDEVEEGSAAEASEDTPPSVLRLRMRRGYYVSLDRPMTANGKRWYRTVRGGYVPADAVAEAEPPSMRGVVLGERWRLPVGFVHRGGVRTLRRDPVRGVLRLEGRVARLTPMPLTEERIVRGPPRLPHERSRPRAAGGRPPDRDADGPAGGGARGRALGPRGPRAADPGGLRGGRAGLRDDGLDGPGGLRDADGGSSASSRSTSPRRWTTPRPEPRATPSRTSLGRCTSRAATRSHGAFWHDRFGRVRSHGCVNLAPVDARWLFTWSTPEVPRAWHGLSTGGGTWVVITA